jgi:hypothetical protein
MNATEELKRISQTSFQEYFQHLHSRWQKCIAVQEGYFKLGLHQIKVILQLTKSGNYQSLHKTNLTRSFNEHPFRQIQFGLSIKEA